MLTEPWWHVAYLFDRAQHRRQIWKIKRFATISEKTWALSQKKKKKQLLERQGLITTSFVFFENEKERAVSKNNSKRVEQGKDVWVISVHKPRYLNSKTGQKNSNKSISQKNMNFIDFMFLQKFQINFLTQAFVSASNSQIIYTNQRISTLEKQPHVKAEHHSTWQRKQYTQSTRPTDK